MILKYQHLLFSILILVGCSPKSDEHSELLVLKGATIIDGTGNPAIENGLLIIKGGRIQKVGRAEAIKIPKGVKIIDFSGKWIVPGYVDAHIHFWESGRTWTSPTYVLDLQKFVSYEEETEFIKNRISYTLEKYLCAGVTSVAPLGAVNWEYKVRTLAEKQQKTPRIYLAGGFIANTPPELDNQYFEGEPTGFWIEKEEDAKKLIAYLDSTNVDLIKAGFIEGDNDYPIEEFLPKLKLLIEESHLRGLPVSVHAMELSNAKHVIRSGADVLAHTVTNKIIDEEFIQLAKQNDVIITSSLGIYKAFKEVFTNSYTLSDMDYCCGDSEVIDSWKEWASIPKEEKPQIPDWIMSAEESFKIMIENTRLANEAGLTISVGTDAGNIGTLHGASFHRELSYLEQAGLTPLEILMAATKNSAMAIGKGDELGTLEIGKQADILVLDRNPLEAVANMGEISQVIVKGKIIDRNELVESNCN